MDHRRRAAPALLNPVGASLYADPEGLAEQVKEDETGLPPGAHNLKFLTLVLPEAAWEALTQAARSSGQTTVALVAKAVARLCEELKAPVDHEDK